MPLDKEIEILESLAQGVDPNTGEIFPADSPYNHPNVIRALHSVLEHVKYPPERLIKPKKSLEEKQAANLSRGLPRSAGMPWGDEEKHALAEAFNSGSSFKELAEAHERTEGAIRSELKRQGLIEE